MKKNSIIDIIIIVLACALTGTITYILMDQKDNKPETKENENKPLENPVEKPNEKPTEKEEEKTLSNSELKKYLNYVPRDIMNEKQNMYKYPNKNNNLSVNILLGSTLDYAINNTKIATEDSYGDGFLLPKTEIDNLLKRLYNKDIIKFSEKEEIVSFSCMQVSLENNNYHLTGGCDDEEEHISVIDTYKATEKELIIYEYSANLFLDFNGIGNIWALEDYKNSYTYKDDSQNFDAEKYLKENKSKFTKYKHTFKKGSDGYYWYNTESVN